MKKILTVTIAIILMLPQQGLCLRPTASINSRSTFSDIDETFFVGDSSPALTLQLGLARVILHDIGNTLQSFPLDFLVENHILADTETFREARIVFEESKGRLERVLEAAKHNKSLEWVDDFRNALSLFNKNVTDELVKTLTDPLYSDIAQVFTATTRHFKLLYSAFLEENLAKETDLSILCEIILWAEIGAYGRFYDLIYEHSEENTNLPLMCEADVYRILLNLVRNAIEAMESERRKLRGPALFEHKGTIRINSSLADNGALVIKVTDTGPGMSKEALQAFRRGISYSSKALGGGRGLRTVQTLVERSNGKIAVDSELGKGTTFTIKLPEPELPELIPSPTDKFLSLINAAA